MARATPPAEAGVPPLGKLWGVSDSSFDEDDVSDSSEVCGSERTLGCVGQMSSSCTGET
jgi:hypothetical protein